MSKKNDPNLTQSEIIQQLIDGLLTIKSDLAALRRKYPPEVHKQLQVRTIDYLLTTPVYDIQEQYNVRVLQLIQALSFIDKQGLSKAYSKYLATLPED